MSPNPTVYVIVRGDIPLADQAVQACHAAFHAGNLSTDLPPHVEPPHLVLMRCKDTAGIESAWNKLEQAGEGGTVFFESDMDDEPTSLATVPISQELGQKLFKFPLWSAE